MVQLLSTSEFNLWFTPIAPLLKNRQTYLQHNIFGKSKLFPLKFDNLGIYQPWFYEGKKKKQHWKQKEGKPIVLERRNISIRKSISEND